jgi:hypothetical protein
MAQCSPAQTDNHRECAIDVTKFAKGKQSTRLSELARIDGTEKLNEDPRQLTVDFHLRPE